MPEPDTVYPLPDAVPVSPGDHLADASPVWKAGESGNTAACPVDGATFGVGELPVRRQGDQATAGLDTEEEGIFWGMDCARVERYRERSGDSR